MQPITYVDVITIDENNKFDVLENYDQLNHFLCLGCMDFLNRNKKNKHNNSFQCLLCGINHQDIVTKKHTKI